MRKNSIKNTRVNSEVQRELAGIIRELKDPRIGPMTAITRCEVATDLKTCKVFISTFGSEEDVEKAMEGLNKASGFIRRELAVGLNLRNTPELHFISDQSIEYGIRMSKRIDEVAQADRLHGGETDEEDQ